MKRRSLPPKEKLPQAPISTYRQKQIQKAKERVQARKWREFTE